MCVCVCVCVCAAQATFAINLQPANVCCCCSWKVRKKITKYTRSLRLVLVRRGVAEKRGTVGENRAIGYLWGVSFFFVILEKCRQISNGLVSTAKRGTHFNDLLYMGICERGGLVRLGGGACLLNRNEGFFV